MDDLQAYLRFLDYLRKSIPDGTVSMSKIPTGYRITVERDRVVFAHDFFPTVITDKDVRRRCVERLLEGLAGLAQEYTKVSVNVNGMVVEFSPRILDRAGFSEGTPVDIQVGMGADDGWVKVVKSTSSPTRISKGKCRFPTRSHDLPKQPRRLASVEFRVSNGAVTMRYA